MAMSTLRLNQLYENASVLNHSFEYRIYASPKGAFGRQLIGETLSELQSLALPQTEKLTQALRTSFAYIRSLLSADGDKYWDDQANQLSSEASSLENLISTSLRAKLGLIVNFLREDAPAISERHSSEVIAQIMKISGKTLLVADTGALGHHYSEWVQANQLSKSVQVLVNKRTLGRLIFEEFACVLLPAAPARFASLEKFDIYLKTLLFSGFAEKVVFVSPKWSHSPKDFNFYEKIFPGLEINPKPKFVLDSDQTQEEFLDSTELEESESLVIGQEHDYDLLDVSGSEPCRLIRLNGNLAYPIEADAKRVSILEFSESEGNWIVVAKNPFDELQLGEILVACVSGSETEALRDRAAQEMGTDYSKFVGKQALWKSRLEEKANELSSSALVVSLLQAGVETAQRFTYWLLPDSIQPGVPTDFQKLLKYLEFSEDEIKEIRLLASKFDGALIKAGRSAGKSLVEALDDADIAQLQTGAALQITLENFGDATYLLAPVEGIDESHTNCKSSQIRQLVHIGN